MTTSHPVSGQAPRDRTADDGRSPKLSVLIVHLFNYLVDMKTLRSLTMTHTALAVDTTSAASHGSAGAPLDRSGVLA